MSRGSRQCYGPRRLAAGPDWANVNGAVLRCRLGDGGGDPDRCVAAARGCPKDAGGGHQI